MLSDLRIE